LLNHRIKTDWILTSIPSDEDEPSPRADADADSYTDMVPEVLETWQAAKSLEDVGGFQFQYHQRKGIFTIARQSN
jgi:hypothetical protein